MVGRQEIFARNLAWNETACCFPLLPRVFGTRARVELDAVYLDVLKEQIMKTANDEN